MMEVNIINPEQTATHATVDSVGEKDFNLHLCARNQNNIQSIESDCRSIIQGLLARS